MMPKERLAEDVGETISRYLALFRSDAARLRAVFIIMDILKLRAHNGESLK